MLKKAAKAAVVFPATFVWLAVFLVFVFAFDLDRCQKRKK